MKMTIDKIIERHYKELQGILRDPDRMVSEAKTDEDYLNDICITALRKFKRKDIEESEGLDYLKKNLRMEMKFKYNRKDKNTTYLEDYSGVSNL